MTLEDSSPALYKARQKLIALYARKGEIEDNYRRLTARKMSGAGADDRQARVQAELEGKVLPPAASVEALLAAEQANFNAIEDAIHIQSNEVRIAEREAGNRFADARKPKYEKIMKRLGSAMTEAYAVLVELDDLRLEFVNSGVGHGRLFTIDLPGSLELPRVRSSDLGDFFREMKKAGFVSAVPKELR